MGQEHCWWSQLAALKLLVDCRLLQGVFWVYYYNAVLWSHCCLSVNYKIILIKKYVYNAFWEAELKAYESPYSKEIMLTCFCDFDKLNLRAPVRPFYKSLKVLSRLSLVRLAQGLLRALLSYFKSLCVYRLCRGFHILQESQNFSQYYSQLTSHFG